MEYPRRDAKYYNDPLREMAGLDRPWTGRDFDRLFYSETDQNNLFGGVKMWEAASLNRWVLFSRQVGVVSGGHLRADAVNEDVNRKRLQDNMVKVDESKWFSFWRKDRWYDLSSDPALTQPTPQGGPWSVDEPKVWDSIRISIEVADRVVKALVRDRHSW